jgi:perosamine synthetase
MRLPEPLYDLEYGHGSEYGPEEEAAVLALLRAGSPQAARPVEQFEEAFAAYCGVPHGVAASSGTAALQLALTAAGVRPGDEVITTPLSWLSTASAATTQGASVVFADVDPRTFTLDPDAVARKLTPRTKAIIAVHLYGQCCDMDALLELARPRGIVVVEDCAHAPGAEYKGRKAGSMGDIGIYSFGQQKNMGTFGEGGMAVTCDAGLAERMRSYRWLCCRGYDPQGKYGKLDETERPMGKAYWRLEFDDAGYNFRMTGLHAAIGLAQLRKLDELNARRIRIAAEYSERLAGVPGLTVPYVEPWAKHVFHIYCVLLDREFGMSKEDFMWELATRKRIRPWSHYMPIHLTAAYRKHGHREGECPAAEGLFDRHVSLPIHPRLKPEAVEYLTRSVRELAERGRTSAASAAGVLRSAQ